MTTAVLEFEVKEDLDRLLKMAKIAGIYTKKRRVSPTPVAQKITQRKKDGFVMGLIASAAQVSDADLEEINAEIALARKEKAEREKCFA